LKAMIKRLSSIFTISGLIAICLSLSYGQPGNNIDDFVFRPRLENLFLVSPHNGVYIDRTGKIALKLNPKLNIAQTEEFSEGLAVVKRGDLYGYIDEKGNLVIEPQFQQAGNFFDGLACVRKPDTTNRTNSPWGYIDKTGKFVYEANFKKARDFSDGLGLAFYDDWYVYLTPSGSVALEGQVLRNMVPHSYSEGLARFCVDGKCGFMDKSGKTVIEPRKEIIGDFHDGRAMIWSPDADNPQFNKRGFIDKTGKVVVEPVWDIANDFSDGVAVVSLRTKNSGEFYVIDTSGKVIIDFKKANIKGFAEVGSFHEGLGRIKVIVSEKVDGGNMYLPRFGFIDKTGRVVINPIFPLVRQFNSGFAYVSYKDYQIGYIDKTGKSIWKGRYR